MNVNLVLVIMAGAFLTMMLPLRVFAPGLYVRYVSRGARPTANSAGKSSRVLAAAILAALIFMAVYSFLARGRNPAVRRPVAPNIAAMRIELDRVPICFHHWNPALAISRGCLDEALAGDN